MIRPLHGKTCFIALSLLIFIFIIIVSHHLDPHLQLQRLGKEHPQQQQLLPHIFQWLIVL